MAQQEISSLPEDAREAKITAERERMRTYDRGRETLPFLRAVQLEPSLPESVSPNENAPIDLHSSSSPLINISDKSSTTSPVDTTRPTRYPSPESRINYPFPQTYPHGPPSPTHSDTSPRDSSPTTPRPIHFDYADRRTPQSEQLTPQSADSHLSTSSFSRAPSPHSQHLDKDRSRLTLPPPGMTGIVGIFECDHVGCTAPAFGTQHSLE